MAKVYPQWAVNDEALKDYYDHYWGVPVHDERVLFEMLTLELFQAGLSWQTIWKRKTAFERAFDNFDINKVAQYDQQKLVALQNDKTIIRNRRKISATVKNAQRLICLHKNGKTLDRFVWSFTNGQSLHKVVTLDAELPSYDERSKQISRQMKKAGFSFVGPTIIFSFLCAVGVYDYEFK